MAKIRVVENIDQATGERYHHRQFLYFCPGCEREHAFGLASEGGHHQFDMNLDSPTVTPSLVMNFVPGEMCHSFIQNGNIMYLSDCTHKLRGQTIELPDIKS